MQRWGRQQFRAIARTPTQQDIWWLNISGGTDFAGGFIAGTPELPQRPGVMQARMMGAAVQAWDENGHPCAAASASYFASYPPGHGRKPGCGDVPPEAGSVWRHGDWLQIGDDRGEGEWCTIFGRSDTTINRHGLRMGTSKIYKAVESQPEVPEAMVVDLEYLGRASYMPLLVVLRESAQLSNAPQQRISASARPWPPSAHCNGLSNLSRSANTKDEHPAIAAQIAIVTPFSGSGYVDVAKLERLATAPGYVRCGLSPPPRSFLARTLSTWNLTRSRRWPCIPTS